jgi:hypothetical protein
VGKSALQKECFRTKKEFADACSNLEKMFGCDGADASAPFAIVVWQLWGVVQHFLLNITAPNPSGKCLMIVIKKLHSKKA